MANSKAALDRNNAVYGAMEVQVLAQRRVELDRPERQILERVGREIAWLLQHDMAENSDHDALAVCGQEICRHLEKRANGEPTAVKAADSGKEERVETTCIIAGEEAMSR